MSTKFERYKKLGNEWFICFLEDPGVEQDIRRFGMLARSYTTAKPSSAMTPRHTSCSSRFDLTNYFAALDMFFEERKTVGHYFDDVNTLINEFESSKFCPYNPKLCLFLPNCRFDFARTKYNLSIRVAPPFDPMG